MADTEPPPPREVTVTTGDELADPSPTQLLILVVGDGVYATEMLPSSGPVALGRASDSDVFIEDPSISRNHAVIHLETPMRIEDLESANGTWVREQRLEPHAPREIALNEPVRLGTVTVIIQRRPTKSRTRRLRSHDYFENRVEDECARAARSGGNFVIVHVVLERATVDLETQIATSLRAGDVVATYAPGELEILLVDTSPVQSERALQRLGQELANRSVKARVGASWYPRDGREPDALAAVARGRAHGEVPVAAAATDVVVADPKMSALHDLVTRVAQTDITVLLIGETGVGKEILAEMIHSRSSRSTKPFFRLNCAALTETLLESELFGHERGAFTGATQAKPGLFEVADGGVLFLDEVGELHPSTQSKLLRVLDERKVLRVGGIKPRSVDVRLVGATNSDLESQVRRGHFRLDLLFRLNAMTIVVPPLRERRPEIEPLARAFLRAVSSKLQRPAPRLAPSAIALLHSYSWPGNIRELRNVIERAVILCTGDQIEASDLPRDKMHSTITTLEPALTTSAATTPAASESQNLDERERILAALESCAGNQTHAAKLLGISRRTLITKIEKLAVPRPRKR